MNLNSPHFFSGRNWLNAAKHVCPLEEAAEFRLDALDEEIATLENKFSGENLRLGFCHNDLQYGNIMIDEETRLVTIIVGILLYAQICQNPFMYVSFSHPLLRHCLIRSISDWELLWMSTRFT